MEITQLTDKENAEFEAKATELAKKYGVTKVHVYVGIDSETDERIVGYIKEPSYIQKIFTLDKIATGGMFAAADSLLDILVLREESDPKTFESVPAFENYKLGMVGTCVGIIEVVQNSFKKK